MVRARRRSRQSLPRSSILVSWQRSSAVRVSVLALRDRARLSGGGGGKYTRISRRTYPEALMSNQRKADWSCIFCLLFASAQPRRTGLE